MPPHMPDTFLDSVCSFLSCFILRNAFASIFVLFYAILSYLLSFPFMYSLSWKMVLQSHQNN